MGDVDVNASGWVCVGCGYALDGLDQSASCPECGARERHYACTRTIPRALNTWVVVGLALAPPALVLVLAARMPPQVAGRFFGWFDFGPRALLVLAPVAVIHGVLVGIVALDSGRLGFGRRMWLASGAILLAPFAVFVDLVVFLLIWVRFGLPLV